MRTLIPPTVNHEGYEPAIDELKLLGHAVLFIKLGHPSFSFEKAWVERARKENPELVVVDSSQGIALEAKDPHFWLTAPALETISKNIFDGLVQVLPKEREELRSNFDSLQIELEKLDQEIRKLLAARKRDDFLVFHPAWGYYAKQYGLRQLAVEEEGKETDAASLMEVIGKARTSGIKTIFAQPQFSKESAEVVAAELGGQVVMVDCFDENIIDELRLATLSFSRALSE